MINFSNRIFSIMLCSALLLVILNACKKDKTDDENKNPAPTSVTDVEGNVYPAVTIGTQTWMAVNLKTTKYKNGTAIPHVTDQSAWNDLESPAYCMHENNSANLNQYGLLYNYYAVATGNLCPTGWRMPTDADWYTLENHIDPSINNPNATNDRGVDAGRKLKANNGWNQNGNGTDTYGFTALPGGTRSLLGSFHYIGDYGYWWTSSTFNDFNAHGRSMFWNNHKIRRDNFPKNNAFSVRCIWE